jgi:quercetin 2,3-dioxygenase
MTSKVIIQTYPLQMPWITLDPFLFCVHHLDQYPKGTKDMRPLANITGRNLSSDFSGKDGWSMYHGREVPGFPRHPHRGFETVTIARQGWIDHSDSLGAKARFGSGDVQWMTAGKGVVHSEMFPLRNQQESNPTELFQIWLNLPQKDKFVDPYFTMFWCDSIPIVRCLDTEKRLSSIQVIAGKWNDVSTPQPPPDSWASNPASDLAIWSISMEPHARLELPSALATTNRMLYFFSGTEISIDNHMVSVGYGINVQPNRALSIVNGSSEAQILLLQGRPIGEPVVSYGPFVMNSQEEIRQAYIDYQRTGFGGWPWKTDAPVHAISQERFAVHADGRTEYGTSEIEKT